MIILPAPIRPDLDCIAGALAYAELLNSQQRTAKVWLTGKPDAEAQFYIDRFGPFVLATDVEGAQADQFIFVDFSEKFAMPDGFDASRVVEIIDHRFPPDVHENFPNATVQLEKVGAAATLIAERLQQAGFMPSNAMATMLYGAIYSNTLCLKGSLTTSRDLDAVAWLKQTHSGCDAYIGQQLDARSREILENPLAALTAEMKMGPSRFGDYGFSQFEINKGERFWSQHGQALTHAMDALPYSVVLNLIDLDGPHSIVYCSDARYQALLPPVFETTAGVGRCNPALMRKEIAPFFR